MLEVCEQVIQLQAIDLGKDQCLQPRDGKPGGIACTWSHLKAIETARDAGFTEALILEDDAVLCDDFHRRFQLFLNSAPDDWCFLFLGMSFLNDHRPVTKHVFRVFDGYAAHAYAVKTGMYDAVLGAVGDRPTLSIDDYYVRLFREHPAYVFIPYLSIQRDDWSDIENQRHGDVAR